MSVSLLKKERIEYMENRLSLAADKAAHALSQMLKCRVDVSMSSLHITDLPGLPGIVENPGTNVVGIRMNMFGDLKGEVFFLLYEKDKDSLMRQINDATFGEGAGVGLDISILEEVGNIVAGVYLTTIYEIAGLNIYHSIPTVAMDMFSSLIADTAIDYLLSAILKKGTAMRNITAKAAGGACMFPVYDGEIKGIGEQNIESINGLLYAMHIPLAGWDLGGNYGRSAEFFLETGRVLIKAIGREDKEI